MYSVWDQFKVIRKIKGGLWFKIEKKGWVTYKLFNRYREKSVDCVILKIECW